MSNIQEILQHTFGYSTFREPQQDIIQTVVDGGDALVLMPTGGGKSLCYQIPALALPGCGVVISPLIALMQDQVSALRPAERSSNHARVNLMDRRILSHGFKWQASRILLDCG